MTIAPLTHLRPRLWLGGGDILKLCSYSVVVRWPCETHYAMGSDLWLRASKHTNFILQHGRPPTITASVRLLSVQDPGLLPMPSRLAPPPTQTTIHLHSIDHPLRRLNLHAPHHLPAPRLQIDQRHPQLSTLEPIKSKAFERRRRRSGTTARIQK